MLHCTQHTIERNKPATISLALKILDYIFTFIAGRHFFRLNDNGKQFCPEDLPTNMEKFNQAEQAASIIIDDRYVECPIFGEGMWHTKIGPKLVHNKMSSCSFF